MMFTFEVSERTKIHQLRFIYGKQVFFLKIDHSTLYGAFLFFSRKKIIVLSSRIEIKLEYGKKKLFKQANIAFLFIEI